MAKCIYVNLTLLKYFCLPNKRAMAGHIFPVLSPHLADPTLTSDKVMKDDRHCWEDLALHLGVLKSAMHGMEDVADEYVRRYPAPSWKNVALALQEMKLSKLADEVTTKYVRGMNVTCDSE